MPFNERIASLKEIFITEIEFKRLKSVEIVGIDRFVGWFSITT